MYVLNFDVLLIIVVKLCTHTHYGSNLFYQYHCCILHTCETLEQLHLNICDKSPGIITCTKFYSPGTCWLVVSHPQNSIHPRMGTLQNPRLCVVCDGTLATYQFRVFFKTIESGPDRVYMLAKQLLPSSSFVLCPGIQEYLPEIRFKTKHLRQGANHLVV